MYLATRAETSLGLGGISVAYDRAPTIIDLADAIVLVGSVLLAGLR